MTLPKWGVTEKNKLAKVPFRGFRGKNVDTLINRKINTNLNYELLY
jgi:hypothetical protein